MIVHGLLAIGHHVAIHVVLGLSLEVSNVPADQTLTASKNVPNQWWIVSTRKVASGKWSLGLHVPTPVDLE